MEQYAQDAVDNIQKTAAAILDVPVEEQTFENTLRPWIRLSEKLVQKFDELSELDQQKASQISDYVHEYLAEVARNPELHQALMNCSVNGVHNEELNAFQRYIGARFIKNDSNEPVYFRGSAEELETSSVDFTVLTLKSDSPLDSGFSNKILSDNADLVCIQAISSDDQAYDCYETLETTYAYFLYVPPAVGLNRLENRSEKGMLIASKYQMERSPCNTFLKGGFRILPIRSHNDRDNDRGAGGSFELGGTLHYGGKDGPQYDAYAKGEAHDNKGNYAEGRVDHNFNSGKGDVDFHGGHREDGNKR